MEHIIPPFSVLMALSGFGLLFSLLLTAAQAVGFRRRAGERPPVRKHSILDYLPRVNLLVAIFIIFGQVFYLVAGLRLARAPRNVYLALLYAPGYGVWKTLQYGRVLLGTKDKEWVRTARNLN
jgi:uncharacterized membrane protein YedE/YeeE